jgi:hypothetical protein
MRKRASLSLIVVSLAAAVPQARGADGNACANGCCPAPCTVLVPQWTTEKRKVTCWEYRTEQRQNTFYVSRPVWEDQEQTYTVMVP